MNNEPVILIQLATLQLTVTWPWPTTTYYIVLLHMLHAAVTVLGKVPVMTLLNWVIFYLAMMSQLRCWTFYIQRHHRSQQATSSDNVTIYDAGPTLMKQSNKSNSYWKCSLVITATNKNVWNSNSLPSKIHSATSVNSSINSRDLLYPACLYTCVEII